MSYFHNEYQNRMNAMAASLYLLQHLTDIVSEQTASDILPAITAIQKELAVQAADIPVKHTEKRLSKNVSYAANGLLRMWNIIPGHRTWEYAEGLPFDAPVTKDSASVMLAFAKDNLLIAYIPLRELHPDASLMIQGYLLYRMCKNTGQVSFKRISGFASLQKKCMKYLKTFGTDTGYDISNHQDILSDFYEKSLKNYGTILKSFCQLTGYFLTKNISEFLYAKNRYQFYIGYSAKNIKDLIITDLYQTENREPVPMMCFRDGYPDLPYLEEKDADLVSSVFEKQYAYLIQGNPRTLNNDEKSIISDTYLEKRKTILPENETLLTDYENTGLLSLFTEPTGQSDVVLSKIPVNCPDSDAYYRRDEDILRQINPKRQETGVRHMLFVLNELEAMVRRIPNQDLLSWLVSRKILTAEKE